MIHFFKRPRGSVSNIFRVNVLNSSVTTFAGLTALTNATANLVGSSICDNEATPESYVATTSILTIATLGTFAAPTAAAIRFKLVDDTNLPGLYEIQVADARFAIAGSKTLQIMFLGAANMQQTTLHIDLTDDAVVLARGTLAAAGSQTSVTLSAGPADDDALNGATIIFQDATTAALRATCTISDYTSGLVATLNEAPNFTVATGTRYVVIAKNAPNLTGYTLSLNGPTMGPSTGTISLAAA